MKSTFLALLTIILFASCGSDSDMTDTDPGDNPNTNGQISQNDYNNISSPCADESNTINLPQALTIMSNYIQYEATAEIFSAHQLSKSLLDGLSFSILPPPSAVYADVDNITVYDGDNAYDWKVGTDTYRYKLLENGYEIRFFEDSELINTGRVLVSVEQSSDCSDFEYTQYAIEEEDGNMIGDIIFRYVYQKAGTATLIKFGTDLSSSENEEYDMRAFEDLSGDMTVRENGVSVRIYNWQSNGNGSYDILEDGLIIESGTWSF